MAFDRAKTSLAFIEERLAKLLGLAGKIDATFDAQIKPTICMADLNDPGTASFRGRHFAYASELLTPGAANTTWGLRFGVGVIIECMWCAGSPIDGGGAGVPTRFPVHILSPAVAIGANPFPTLLVNSGTWTDNKQSETDLPPIFHGPSGGAQTGTAGAFAQLTVANRLWVAGFSGGSILAGAMTTPPSWKGAHLPPQGELRCPTTLIGTGTSLTFGCMGRIA